MKKIWVFFISFFILLAFSSQNLLGQDITLKQTLTYLNGKFQGTYILDINKGNLIVDCFKNGTKYRQDKVFLGDLDPRSVEYVIAENGIRIKCLSEKEECISRKIYSPETKGYYGRILFIINADDKAINGIKKAFIHMIKLIQDSSYNSSEPFE